MTAELPTAPGVVVVDPDPSGFVYLATVRCSKTNGEVSPIPWDCPDGGVCLAASVGDGVLFGLLDTSHLGGPGIPSLLVAPLAGGATTSLWTGTTPDAGESVDPIGVVADATNVYWISSSWVLSIDGRTVESASSTLWRAPAQGGGSPVALWSDTIAGIPVSLAQGFTGTALDDTFIYFTTSDGRLLRLPK